jgi:hypothetical protein
MTESQARSILHRNLGTGDDLVDDGLNCIAWNKHAIVNPIHRPMVFLEGHFTDDELEALVWWIRNMGS